ncbi:HupE/UreJ family protein [Shewanella sp. FJAT-52076]|uniref:HupE/UreJ family protein n=1 Tax=Shewanella sp. FJAT-52076 TaxID=2864202 RepID=UPI001C661B3D|nr:HupE/UreJ family protein [Shewanella sp. FJAT-52076]QYJ75023.1 HupE/UreJ family protein [Shewanella sp. FJAT-52076]
MRKGVWLWCLLFSAGASAHEVALGGGFGAGFSHPVLGLDHLLAMLSVGMVSTRLGRHAIWQVPLAFLCFMSLGAVLGITDIALPLVEAGIALSVMLLGLAIAFNRALPLWPAMLAVAIFGIFHGHAHGMEMPTLASPWLYGLGFILGTATIHLIGVFTGLLLAMKERRYPLTRITGAGIAAMGTLFLIGTVLPG